jgi:hypothetical protein
MAEGIGKLMILGNETPAPMKLPQCGKCGGAMEEGFIRDTTEGFNRVQTIAWIKGSPAYGVIGNLKIGDRKMLPCRSFRCVTCGYLESYAIG